MRALIKKLREEVGGGGGAPLDLASPWFRYGFLLALWSVIWIDSLLMCCLFYIVFLSVSLLGHTSPFRPLVVLLVVALIVVGHLIFSLYSSGEVSAATVRVALKAHLLFGSAPVIFSSTTTIEHFYAWSSVLGGTLAGAIVGMGRSISYFPKIILETRDSFRIRGKGPLGSPLAFAMNLLASVLYFARTYSDALEVRDAHELRGEGSLGESVNAVEVLMLLVSGLLIVLVMTEKWN